MIHREDVLKFLQSPIDTDENTKDTCLRCGQDSDGASAIDIAHEQTAYFLGNHRVQSEDFFSFQTYLDKIYRLEPLASYATLKKSFFLFFLIFSFVFWVMGCLRTRSPRAVPLRRPPWWSPSSRMHHQTWTCGSQSSAWEPPSP